MTIKRDISWRVYLSFIGLTILSLAVLGKIVKTQQLEGKYWISVADSFSTSYREIDADRGNIYSADGRLLATSLPFFEIRMNTCAPWLNDSTFYRNVDSLALCMAALIRDTTADAYRKYIIKGRKRGDHYLRLSRRDVNYTELLQIRKFPMINMGRYKNCLTEIEKSKRINPFHYLARRTIGIQRDSQAIGLEASYNDFLKGVKGLQLMQKIPGTWIPLTDDFVNEPIHGKDIITTIDVGLQDVAENALLNTLLQNNADHGCVIMMEVKTGKIKAIANIGRNSKGLYDEIENYAVKEAIDPGSTFKMASCAALLESGLVDTSTIVDLEGGHKFYGVLVHGRPVGVTANDHELKENVVTLKHAFEISSNVGISKLVTANFYGNQQRYYDYLYGFGLNDLTGIDLANEHQPYIKDTKDKTFNKVTSLPEMSVGYELNITPLQTLCFYNTIANDGKRMKPYLVEEIREFGKTIKFNQPVVQREQIVSLKTIGKLKAMMEGVVIRGTASKVLDNKNYTIAGKTGTAQINQGGKAAYANKNGGQKKFLASFVGYFPADHPMYSCIVVVYNPNKDKSVYYGSQVACPVFKELANKVYATSTSLHAPIDRKDTSLHPYDKPLAFCGLAEDIEPLVKELHFPMMGDMEAIWMNCKKAMTSYQVNERKVVSGQVPNVIGLSVKDAVCLLENAGFKVKLNGNGKVNQQQPAAGTTAQPGQVVQLTLGLKTVLATIKDSTKTE